ncbi:hypothetical protein ACFLWZ_04730 [Chloroflexota bacterium]
MKILPSTWKAKLKDGSWQILNDKEQLVCTVANSQNTEANAGLIALSPYMLEALKRVSELIDDEDLPDNGELSGAAICDMVRSAIELTTSK